MFEGVRIRLGAGFKAWYGMVDVCQCCAIPREVKRRNRVTVDSEVRINSSISDDDLTGPVKEARTNSSISDDDLTGLLVYVVLII